MRQISGDLLKAHFDATKSDKLVPIFINLHFGQIFILEFWANFNPGHRRQRLV
jgi:hypothetical protein